METKNIEIKLTFGSKFQKEIYLKLFATMLYTLQAQMEMRHKKNKCEIFPKKLLD